MNISMTKWCKQNRLAKTTVYERCRELGLDVSDGLTEDHIERLENEFDLSPSKGSASNAIRPVVMPQGFIKSDELVAVKDVELALPEGFDPAAMVRFFDGAVGEGVDGDGLLAMADVAIGAVSSAFDKKLEVQRQQLTATSQKAGELQKKVDAAKEDMKIKALESRLLAQMQSQQTSVATTAFQELMALGKPQDEPQEESGQ